MALKSKPVVIEETDSSESEILDDNCVDEEISNSISDAMESDDRMNEESDGSNDECTKSKNLGWADAMAKVLRSNTKTDKNFILSKAKKDSEIKAKVNKEIELVDESGKMINEMKELSKEKNKSYVMRRKEMLEKQKQKAMWENMCHTKPDVTHKDKERELIKIATRGIVHLFNTVEKHQKSITKMKEGKKDKKVKNTKGNFIDILKGSVKQDSKTRAIPIKDKKDETWSILKDDFMMGAEMKDWDKKSDDENK